MRAPKSEDTLHRTAATSGAATAPDVEDVPRTRIPFVTSYTSQRYGVAGTSDEEGMRIAKDELTKIPEDTVPSLDEEVEDGEEHLFVTKGQQRLVAQSPNNSEGTSDEEDERQAKDELTKIQEDTGLNLVEEVADGKKLMFLTNAQAVLLAQSPESVQKIFEEFEVGAPSLFIDLLTSAGFTAWTKMLPENAERIRREGFFGVVPDKPAFVNADEEEEAESAIDVFMAAVLVPLAAATNAIVLCDAIAGNCVLSDSFLRAATVAESSWSRKMPFTVISSTCNIDELYNGYAARKKYNEDGGNCEPYWRGVQKASVNWRLRHMMLKRTFGTPGKRADGWRSFDLNPAAACLILTDNICESGGTRQRRKVDYSAHEALHAAMIRHLRSTLPAVAFRTGVTIRQATVANKKRWVETLSAALAHAQAGVPLVFLDVRKRSLRDVDVHVKGESPEDTRNRLLDSGKKQVEAYIAELYKGGLAESMDACTLAFLHDLLFGQKHEDPKPEKLGPWPLHHAIQRARSDRDPDAGIPRATNEQVLDAAAWLSNAIFNSAWQILDQKAKGKYATCHEAWRGDLQTHITLSRALLLSPNFHSLNLHETRDFDMVRHLVDRLPPSTPLDGLLLLQDAWREFDIAVSLATSYKFLCKFLLRLQLVVAWLVVAWEAFESMLERSGDARLSDSALVKESGSIIFALAVLASALVALDSMYIPKARWRHLRSCAGSLESMIWMYRARVGVFVTDFVRKDSRPEMAFYTCLAEWRRTLMAGASLMTTIIQRRHPARIFRHYQDTGPLTLKEGSDDHHSPVSPQRYIELRIEPQIEFYSNRIPVCTRRSTVLKRMVLALGACASILAHYRFLPVVVIVTALTTALTSWSAFADYSRKVARYSSALVDLKNLLSWWKTVDDVKKVRKESIECLVRSAEEIISRERTSWMSIAGVTEAENKGDGDPRKRFEVSQPPSSIGTWGSRKVLPVHENSAGTGTA